MRKKLQSYSEYLNEAVKLDKDTLKIINKHFEKVVEVKKSSKMVTYKLLSKDRQKAKESLMADLQKNGIQFIESLVGGSSIQPIEIMDGNVKYRFFFKPISGGMTETTLNSTITELIPAIMFNDGISDTNPKRLYDKILNGNVSGKSFVNKKDQQSGMEFIQQMGDSSKFEEKFENAMAIYDYLVATDKTEKISRVYWTYRAKPAGVPSNSPADIVVEFNNGSMLGVSLKAGGSKTKEPLLNTYVSRVAEFFGIRTDDLEKDLYNLTYKYLDLPVDYRKSKETLPKLVELEKEDPEKYNEMYDKNLSYLKKRFMDTLPRDKAKFIKFIKAAILKDDGSIPLTIVKAVGRKYKTVEDDNELLAIIPFIDKIEAEDSTSKQKFFINLKTGKGNAKMIFSIRSNKPGVQHKLGQYWNLAIKYNGLK